MKTSQCTNGKKIAMFQGSFDPFTRGHESIVRRALPLFDEIVVAVVSNIAKKPFMSLSNRLEFIKQVFADEPRVRVVASDGLTVDVAREVGATCLLRGVRMIQDFENEMHMAEINRRLSGIETVLLYTLPEFSHISSTIVRELYNYNQPVNEYIPENAKIELLGK
ncbi:MAG: pantetheine-phosphate adenylyltransferase [Muribaculaceae bacterium]|nr:pantetheine-phosphate adenylyltransferase [Muribaculaceae bacterium]